MFTFKQFMIVDKITQWDRVIVNNYCARWCRWHFIGKFRVEDTEAHQEMIRMNYKTLRRRNFDGYFSHFTVCRFGLSLFLEILLTIHYYPLVQTTKTIINYLVEFGHVQTTWYLMISNDSRWQCTIVLVPVQTRVMVESIIHYRDRLNEA